MYVDSTWAYKPIKPVIDAEPSYEDIPQGLHDANEKRWLDCDVRRYAYWSVFAGSFGHTYGHNAIMQFLKPGYGTSYGDAGDVKTWYQAMKDPGFSQMQYVKRLMLTFPYFERVPDQKVISGENGKQYNRLIATRGKDYLMVYNYTGRDMKIDLRTISGKAKKVFWMDAATGHLEYIGEVADKIQTFRPASSHEGVNDGVLIAFDAKKEYLKPDMTIIPEQSDWKNLRDLNE